MAGMASEAPTFLCNQAQVKDVGFLNWGVVDLGEVAVEVMSFKHIAVFACRVCGGVGFPVNVRAIDVTSQDDVLLFFSVVH